MRKMAPSHIYGILTSTTLTLGLLIIIRLKVKNPVLLLADRFLPGLGWVEILLLAIYAGWLTHKMADPQHSPRLRIRIWQWFSLVFFTQLGLGLLGFEKFLMTGKLHLPVPAVILAGPIFRGEGFFMPILFLATIALVGSAWCSYLCYLGAWDNLAAKHKKIPQKLPPWRFLARIGLFLGVILAAFLLKVSGAAGTFATTAGILFGLIGLTIMVGFSRQKGVMVHCTIYCPMGLAANLLGKLNPFRLHISNSCSECGACTPVCRYDALNKRDIQNRKPGLTCTLCGDCLHRCHEKAIHYHFFSLSPDKARQFFIVITVVLHTLFLAVARL